MKISKRIAMGTGVTVFAGALSLAGAAAPALAGDYGPAQHQVEISANFPPDVFGAGTGGGIWLWIELSGSATGGIGTYQGSDCLHHALGSTGAHPDSGDVTWAESGGSIVISGVVIGGDVPATITVPDSGHESVPVSDVFSPPIGTFPGTAQVQVAP
jgi:hypothetical protein